MQIIHFNKINNIILCTNHSWQFLKVMNGGSKSYLPCEKTAQFTVRVQSMTLDMGDKSNTLSAG